jgi:hypothetical protein
MVPVPLSSFLFIFLFRQERAGRKRKIRELLKIHFNREGREEREELKINLHYIIQYIIKQTDACFHAFLRTLRVLRGYF